MNNDTIHAGADRSALRALSTVAAEVLHPTMSGASPARRRLLLIRQVVAFAGTAVTLVQVIVWLMIALLGGGLTGPWWLWTAVPVVAAVAALTAAARPGAGERRA